MIDDTVYIVVLFPPVRSSCGGIKIEISQVISSSSELNFKEYKDNRTKKCKQLSTDTIKKAIIIQAALLSEEKRLDDDPITKVLCWSDDDLMVAADTSLIRSQREVVIKEFNKFIEPWEDVATTEESFGNHRRLLRKFEHVCIFDEEGERRLYYWWWAEEEL